MLASPGNSAPVRLSSTLTDPRRRGVCSKEAQTGSRRRRHNELRSHGLVRARGRVVDSASPVRAVLNIGMVGLSVVDDAVQGARLVSTGLAALDAVLQRGAREDRRCEEDVGEKSSDEHDEDRCGRPGGLLELYLELKKLWTVSRNIFYTLTAAVRAICCTGRPGK